MRVVSINVEGMDGRMVKLFSSGILLCRCSDPLCNQPFLVFSNMGVMTCPHCQALGVCSWGKLKADPLFGSSTSTIRFVPDPHPNTPLKPNLVETVDMRPPEQVITTPVDPANEETDDGSSHEDQG